MLTWHAGSPYDGIVVNLRTYLRTAALASWARATDAEKKATASHAATSYWARLSPEPRSAEMKGRAKKRTRRR